jgi:hypothetical protein
MAAQVGIWSYLLVRGSIHAASVVLEPLTAVLDEPATGWFAPEIKSCKGFSAFYQGRLDEAHRWLGDAWEGYRSRPAHATASPSWPLPHDPVPVTAVALACVTALQGRMDESAQWELRATVTASQLDFPSGPFSAAFVAVYQAWIRLVTGSADEAREFGLLAMEIADRHGFDYFQLLGRQYVLVPEPGRPCDMTELETYGSAMDLVGHAAFRPVYLGIVARNLYYLGEADRALQVLGDALDRARSSGEFVHQPDLLRLRAQIIAATHPGRMEEAVTDLDHAVDIGLVQGSFFLALRAANDLARLSHDVRPADWAETIRSVLARLPSDFSRPELADAHQLLGS